MKYCLFANGNVRIVHGLPKVPLNNNIKLLQSFSYCQLYSWHNNCQLYSWHSVYDMFSKDKYLSVNLVFSHPHGFGVGISFYMRHFLIIAYLYLFTQDYVCILVLEWHYCFDDLSV